jgi:hypothetical protein
VVLGLRGRSCIQCAVSSSNERHKNFGFGLHSHNRHYRHQILKRDIDEYDAAHCAMNKCSFPSKLQGKLFTSGLPSRKGYKEHSLLTA